MSTDKETLDGLLRKFPESFVSAAALTGQGFRVRFVVIKSDEMADCYDVLRVQAQMPDGKWVDLATAMVEAMQVARVMLGRGRSDGK